jgi:hypothetical protein
MLAGRETASLPVRNLPQKPLQWSFLSETCVNFHKFSLAASQEGLSSMQLLRVRIYFLWIIHIDAAQFANYYALAIHQPSTSTFFVDCKGFQSL